MATKTVRFYEANKKDLEALRILEDHKAYGYRDENHMIKALLLDFGSTKEEDLAEAIAKKVVERLGEGQSFSPVSSKTDQTFLKACAFMDAL